MQTLTRDLTDAVESCLKVLDTNMLTSVIGQMINCVAPSPDTTPQFPSLLISPESPSSSRECSAVGEDSVSILDTT